MCDCVVMARPTRDHPREYGENSMWLLTGSAPRGPSPRIRGEYAHAQRIPEQYRDHPREYGENYLN